ncbi:uncharacterized protein LOC131928930 [Physella acuta]|uniref:uncharacterized protein LOC131928930 n=1 Tax=Physella acuta TaxID=109671 RepID=UPI0027DCC613|nr:uncharacterized protein LOC131928930 [Physella acuta]
MLLTPRQEDYYNINNNNQSPQHRGHMADNLACQLTGQLMANSTKCYSPRPSLKSKVPPHITICPPDSVDGHDFINYMPDDELDNDAFQPSNSSSHPSSSYSDEKHEVHSGRLYLIRHTGGAASSSPCASPTRSPSKASPFKLSTSPLSSSPTSSPSRKMSVFVRVYRCNMDHFAVISRDCLYTSKPVYVNMRHCRVLPGDCLGRFIVAGKCDSGNVIEFETLDLSSLEQWLDAFQTLTPPASPNRVAGGGNPGVTGGNSSPSIPRSPALPTLAETDEED